MYSKKALRYSVIRGELEAAEVGGYMKTVVTISTKNGYLHFYGISETIIRCVFTKKGAVNDCSSIGINLEANIELEECEDDDFYIIKTSRLCIFVDKRTEKVTWKTVEGDTFLTEKSKTLTETPVITYTTGDEEPIIKRVKTVDGERNFVENLKAVTDHMAYRAKINFDFADGEQIHGLGQGEDGIFDYRGKVQYLYQHNMRIPIPFILSSKGYGLLVDAGCLATFNDDERGSYLFLENVEQLDYYVIYGPNAADIIAGQRHLTGKAAMLPKWAFGYVQSKETYHNQDELIEVAKEYRKRGLPIDCVVQDWKSWQGDEWGCKRVDKSRYPNLKVANDTLKEMNVHSMVSIWPNMNSGTEDYEEMISRGYMLNDLATYDAFSEEARGIYWNQMDRDLFSGGFDAWWCDSTEPFSGPDWNGEEKREPWERYKLVGGEHEKFLGAQRANLYAVYHAKGIYENQRKSCSQKRVLNLTRSGYPSIQKYGTVLWSGDTAATWDVFEKQITEGLNMSASGMPYWTWDIGAFFVIKDEWQRRGCECNNDPSVKWFWQGDYEDGVNDLGYRELYTRWFEVGAFLPMFRSHGTDTPREIWNFGKPGELFYDALEKVLRLRYKLMPYIYSLAGSVVLRDCNMIKPLFFDFPNDARASKEHTQFMFGDSIMVCPVTYPMYYEKESRQIKNSNKTCTCYLPKGTKWYDFYSEEMHEGGKEIVTSAPLGKMPLFVKAGSVIPMEESLSYAEEYANTPLWIKIYPGVDGEFYYYEDSGNDYSYENGMYNDIKMTWKDKERCFTIAESANDFEKGIKGRECIVVLGSKTKQFVYEGKEIRIQM